MKSKKHKINQSICVYGAGVLLKHLQAMEDELDGVQSGGEDIEYIHRMRVASRRLRSAFPLFGMCFQAKKSTVWLNQIKNMTQALGSARDADVQIAALRDFADQLSERQARPGVLRLLLRMRQKRRRMQAPLEKAIQNLKDSRVCDEMRKRFTTLAELQESMYLYTPALYQHSYNAIRERLDDLLTYEAIVFQPEKKEELHAMRISAKWLRYTLENLAPLYQNNLKPFLQTVRTAQDLLGDIHDYDVWVDFLPRFFTKERQRTIDFFGSDRYFKRIVPGITHFSENRQALRVERYQQFTDAWRQWQAEGVWDQLNDVIRLPFDPAMGLPPTSRPAENDSTQDTAMEDHSSAMETHPSAMEDPQPSA